MGYTILPNESLERFSELSGKATHVYLLFRSKLRYKRGTIIPMDDIIEFSYGEAERFGISRQTFSRSIKQLIKLELIEIYKKGIFGKGGKNITKYKIL